MRIMLLVEGSILACDSRERRVIIKTKPNYDDDDEKKMMIIFPTLLQHTVYSSNVI